MFLESSFERVEKAQCHFSLCISKEMAKSPAQTASLSVLCFLSGSSVFSDRVGADFAEGGKRHSDDNKYCLDHLLPKRSEFFYIGQQKILCGFLSTQFGI